MRKLTHLDCGCKLYAEVVDNIGLLFKLAVTNVVLSNLDVKADMLVLTITAGIHLKLGIS